MPPQTSRTGKIARLPNSIREDLNRRIQEGEPVKSLLDWLNALPEVQNVLRLHFQSRPIAPSNFTEWKNGGYLDWCAHQQVLAMVQSLSDQDALGDQLLHERFNDKLAQWTSLHLAATARTLLAMQEDPAARFSLLHQLTGDINRLRRNDLQAERLTIERGRLELETATAKERTEQVFWAWTKRPEIANKLNPAKALGITEAQLYEFEETFGLLRRNRDRQERPKEAEPQAHSSAQTLVPSPSAPQPIGPTSALPPNEAETEVLETETPLNGTFLKGESSNSAASSTPPAPEPNPGLLPQTPSAPSSSPHPNVLSPADVPVAAPPSLIPVLEFCIRCHARLPALNSANQRPFPRCRRCGDQLPPPGQAFSRLPDHPPLYKPLEHCPHCDATLPPLRPNGERADNWCPNCLTSLPSPDDIIEHCDQCGCRVPPVAPGYPRPCSSCNGCGHTLPPVLSKDPMLP